MFNSIKPLAINLIRQFGGTMKSAEKASISHSGQTHRDLKNELRSSKDASQKKKKKLIQLDLSF